jgi:hypothetical protein
MRFYFSDMRDYYIAIKLAKFIDEAMNISLYK